MRPFQLVIIGISAMGVAYRLFESGRASAKGGSMKREVHAGELVFDALLWFLLLLGAIFLWEWP